MQSSTYLLHLTRTYLHVCQMQHADIMLCVFWFVSVAFGRKPPPLVFGGSGEGEQSATEPVFVEFKLRLSARDD